MRVSFGAMVSDPALACATEHRLHGWQGTQAEAAARHHAASPQRPVARPDEELSLNAIIALASKISEAA